MNILQILMKTPVINSLIYRYLNYLDNRDDKRAKTVLLAAQTRSVQVITKNLMQEGLKRIKQGVKADHSMESLKSGALSGMDLAKYAQGDHAKQSETLAKAYVYYGSDIKNEIDRARMANKRVEDYRQLQNNTLQRQLIRAIRKETDPAKKAKLMEEFKTKLKESVK